MTYRQPFEGDWPITQKYGEIIPGVTYKNEPHTGIDYGCPLGTPILASNSGVVMVAKTDQTSYNGGYGKYVIIQHDDGNATLYAHLSQYVVAAGQKVKQSEVIGYSGSTGNSSGPHLHFEARRVWSDFRTHFNPIELPLMSSYQPAVKPDIPQNFPQFPTPVKKLKDAEDLGDDVVVVAPSGVKAFDENYNWVQNYACGTELIFTGNVKIRPDNGFTYCEVYQKLWVAVNDGETQILDNNLAKIT